MEDLTGVETFVDVESLVDADTFVDVDTFTGVETLIGVELFTVAPVHRPKLESHPYTSSVSRAKQYTYRVWLGRVVLCGHVKQNQSENWQPGQLRLGYEREEYSAARLLANGNQICTKSRREVQSTALRNHHRTVQNVSDLTYTIPSAVCI